MIGVARTAIGTVALLTCLAHTGSAWAERVTVCGKSYPVDARHITCGAELTGIEALTAVETVSLFRLPADADLADLASLPSLTRLTITGDARAPFDLRRLPALPGLEMARLDHVDVATIGALEGVESITLGVTEPTSLAPLKQLRALKTLVVSARGKKLTGVEALPTGLTTLKLSRADLADAPCPSHLAQLEVLALDTSADRSCVGALPHLKVFEAGRVNDLSLFSSGFATLKRLEVFTSATDLTPLARLETLESIKLVLNSDADLRPLGALKRLQGLDLAGSEHVASIAWISGLTELTWVRLGKTAVADLTPLAGLTKLTSLDVDDTPVRDLAPLAGLTELTSLDISFTRVRSLKPLFEHTRLTSLGLHAVRVPRAHVKRLERTNPELVVSSKP